MTDVKPDVTSDMTPTTPTPEELDHLILILRRKMGNWLEWAEACQTLQKAGYTDQTIFEGTGFEAIQQNQIMVAVQVYKSMVAIGVKPETAAHFQGRASDVLYEFRTLSPAERAAAADFAFERKMDQDEARELGKAVKDFSRISQPPSEFSSHPGDIMAYFAWRAAKQKTDLQARTILIAKALKYVQSTPARKQIEALLLNFAQTPEKLAPRLPVYRLDSDEELPTVIPVIGLMPLTKADFQAPPLYDCEEPFGLVRFSGNGAYIAVPGYSVIRNCSDPIAFLMEANQLPTRLPGSSEQVLIVVDRANRDWKSDTYFVVANAEDQLELNWFEAPPETQILGRVILLLRPKKVLDESYTKELMQFEE